MATFNPTDREGSQVLAMAKERKVEKKEEDKPTDAVAKDPKNVDPNVKPDIPKPKEKPKDEDLEIDTDLRLFIEPAGRGGKPILLKDGAIDVYKSDSLDPTNKDGTDNPDGQELMKALKKMADNRKAKAKELALKNNSEGSPGYEEAFNTEFAKLKVRVQPNVDTPWGEVFKAMNRCTEAGFKTVALTTPKDYVPKEAPKD